MHYQLSASIQRIKVSPTAVTIMRAAELQAAGKDIISLGLGEPDFDTPLHIKEAAITALYQGATKYTETDGTSGLKQAILQKFAKENNLSYEPKQIIACCGAKQALFNLFAILLNKGDEVIIPVPYWVSYPDIALFTGATPVFITAAIDQGFKITPQQLRKVLTPQTRLIILNSPSNPTGMVYNKSELQALAEVILPHKQVIVATDDIYEHIYWAKEPFANIVNVCPELYDRTVVINGVSKAYAMTGWRIGYAAGPIPLIAAMKKLQSQSTSNPTTVAQAAAKAALSGEQTCVKDMAKQFQKRHDLVYKEINAVPGISCLPAQGAFYSFIAVSEAMAKKGITSDIALTDYLLDQAGIAVIPGSAFGIPGYIRISYAASEDTLLKAIGRIRDALVA